MFCARRDERSGDQRRLVRGHPDLLEPVEQLRLAQVPGRELLTRRVGTRARRGTDDADRPHPPQL
jgi:hypothetical protein